MLLKWEEIECEKAEKSFLSAGMMPMLRARVPGGWFVQISGISAFFYPDPEHLWDGSSLP